MNRVLVTGASGFVGRALCRSLRERGIEFVTAARTGAPPIPGCLRQVRVDSLGGATDWSDALSGMTSVVHLAGEAHRVRSESPVAALARHRAVTVAGTLQLARAAARGGVRRLVYVSTVKVFGEGCTGSDIVAYNERHAPAPQDAYAIAKWEAELGLRQVVATTGLEVVILRPPLVYGPGVGANFLRLMKRVAAGWPMPLRNIENRRSLIYLGNLIDALHLSLSHERAASRTFLVSDGEDVSTPVLICRVAEALGVAPRLFAFPSPVLRLAAVAGLGHTLSRLTRSLVVDIGAIRHDLRWSPPFTMTQGLQVTADWFHQSHGR